MKEELKHASIISRALSKLGNSSLGLGLGMGLFMLGIGLAFSLDKWDGHLYDRKGCVQLQEIKDKIFKVDTCTGDVEELPSSKMAKEKPEKTESEIKAENGLR